MSPEIVLGKLSRMSQYLRDLTPHKDSAYEEFVADHYKIERLIELLVMSASDIVFRLLVMKGEPPPGSYRAAFLRSGEMGILSEKLSRNLALGAGLRNILIHEYEKIDYEVLYESIPQILKDLTEFMEQISNRI